MNGGTITFKFTGDTKDLDKKVDSVKSSVSSKMASVGSAIGKGVAVGVASATTALVGFSKASVSAFADYEQLTGGIETLFGKSADEVMKKTEQAYKTAGISANNYMNTVMSFSASLKQAVKGDTKKMTQYADMAVIDMADNANKMGTSMESIQTAYAGFAKQNFTLLDNLKLGYGGTKTEMERLIADANKIKKANGEMANLSIDSFADITEAIHIMQTEMGITGTTAKEAQTTISGSLGMLKASYEDLLVAFSSGDNIDSALDNVMKSAMTFGKNVVPVIEKAVDNIVKYLPEVADSVIKAIPKILDKIVPKAFELLNSVVNSIVEALPNLVPVLINGILLLVQALTTNLPTIIQAIVSMLPVIAAGIAEALPTLIPQIVEAIIGLMKVFNDNMPLFLECGVKIIWGIVKGLLNSIPTILQNLPTIIMFIVNFFTAEKLLSAGKTLITGLWNGLKDGFITFLKEIPKLIGKLITAFKNGGSLKDVGINLIKGLWNGIASVKDWIIGKIGGFTSSVLKSIKSFFGIHSPSKLMANEVGQYLPKGMAVGIDANVDSVYNSIEDMQPEIQKDLNGLFNLSPQMTGAMNNNISPVINVNSNINVEQDNLGQFVKNVKSYSGGAKNDYSFGLGR